MYHRYVQYASAGKTTGSVVQGTALIQTPVDRLSHKLASRKAAEAKIRPRALWDSLLGASSTLQ